MLWLVFCLSPLETNHKNLRMIISNEQHLKFSTGPNNYFHYLMTGSTTGCSLVKGAHLQPQQEAFCKFQKNSAKISLLQEICYTQLFDQLFIYKYTGE